MFFERGYKNQLMEHNTILNLPWLSARALKEKDAIKKKGVKWQSSTPIPQTFA